MKWFEGLIDWLLDHPVVFGFAITLVVLAGAIAVAYGLGAFGPQEVTCR